MKVSVHHNTLPPDKPFPKLMIGTRSDNLYLMLNPTSGVRLKGISSTSTVHLHCDLLPSELQEFKGTVTLSNED